MAGLGALQRQLIHQRRHGCGRIAFRQSPDAIAPSNATATRDQRAGSSGHKSGVVIVGGGPAGLASALMLAQRGWTDITVVERSQAVTYADPDRSYVYAIDGRSQKLLDGLGLWEQVKAAGIDMQEATIRTVTPDGKMKISTIPTKNTKSTVYWMPRSVLMRVLEGEARQGPLASRIRILTSATATALKRVPVPEGAPAGGGAAAGQLAVDAEVAGGEHLSFNPRLVVAADGMRSMVRDTLQEWQPGRFGCTELPSESTGLRFKVLMLPPNPVMRSGEVLPNPDISLILGHPASKLRIGLLPVRDSTAQRPANIITKPGHPIWDITSGEDMYRYFEQHIPQVDFRALVKPEAMEAYAKSRGGTFPAPRYAHDLAFALPATSGADAAAAVGSSGQSAAATAGGASSGATTIAGGDHGLAATFHGEEDGSNGAPAGVQGASGVLLVGDALHSFPPDLGQGVNSALEDVAVLRDQLEACNDDLAQALPRYQAARTADAQALAKLVQVGYPQQYDRSTLGHTIWLAKFLATLTLSKLLPGVFSPPIFTAVQDSSLSYSTILQRTQQTSRRLAALLAILVLAVAALVLRGGA